MKKSAASEAKFAKVSVFIPTPEEKFAAQNRQSQYVGVAAAFIGAGASLNPAIDLNLETKADLSKALSNLLGPNDKLLERKKTVQFTLPRGKRVQPVSYTHLTLPTKRIV